MTTHHEGVDSGWEQIEQHFIEHDTPEIKDYAEDIDSLLVFAGLFSAILTAFVVQTYPMLTDDDNATTNQLFAIAALVQTQATGVILPPLLNSTVVQNLYPPPFAPSAAVRAINILLFLSLLLSLASAFFGILAKQWIREYLKWTSPLALPRENVLVRQARVEAWAAWNVPATISSIPVLLEVAMMLFLCGIVILLWTLDSVTAVVISVATTLVLSGAAAFTLLPIIFVRCPYKSPTAWACLAAYNILIWTIILCSELVQRCVCHCLEAITSVLGSLKCAHHKIACWRVALSQRPAQLDPPSSWRERDLASCRQPLAKANGQLVGRRTVWNTAYEELCTVSIDPSPFIVGHILQDISETVLLIRALEWMLQSSQDSRVRHAIERCAGAMHPHPPPDESQFDTSNALLVADRHILLALQAGSIDVPHSSLFLDREFSTALLKPFQEDWPIVPQYETWILGHMLAADIKVVVASPSQAAVELCAIVQRVTEDRAWNYHSGTRPILRDEACTWYQDALRFMVQAQFNLQDHQDTRLSVFREAVLHGKLAPTVDSPLLRLEISPGRTMPADYGVLLLSWFDEQRFTAESDEYLAMFFDAVAGWLYDEDDGALVSIPAETVLHKLRLAVEETLQRSRGRLTYLGIANDQSVAIVQALCRHRYSLLNLCSDEVVQLTHALESALRHLSLQSEGTKLGIWRHLHPLIQEAHHMFSHRHECAIVGCQWSSHECDSSAATKFMECDLFAVYRLSGSGSASARSGT